MNIRRKWFGLVMLCSLSAGAQESTSVFNFLTLPTSSHATALGGRNISLIEDDASLTLQNPALMANVGDNAINFNFMTYMKGCKAGSAGFTKIAGERGTWGAHVQFVGYGNMTETTVTGEQLGDVSALDMSFNGMYTYNLSDRWAGGVTGKFIYSKYAEYTSVGLAVDLGLNYYDDEKNFSFSAVAANLGGQVKAFGEVHERLPFNLQAGFTKGVAHAPISISVTLTDLSRWSSRYYYNASKNPGFGKILINHFNMGVDIKPAGPVYLAAGYNFRRAYEMKAAGSSHAAGLTFGAGVSVKKFLFGLAYAKYHVSAPTLSFSMQYHI